MWQGRPGQGWGPLGWVSGAGTRGQRVSEGWMGIGQVRPESAVAGLGRRAWGSRPQVGTPRAISRPFWSEVHTGHYGPAEAWLRFTSLALRPTGFRFRGWGWGMNLTLDPANPSGLIENLCHISKV